MFLTFTHKNVSLTLADALKLMTQGVRHSCSNSKPVHTEMLRVEK